MSRIRTAVAAVLAMIALTFGTPTPALAAGDWAWPVDGEVMVAYGARYVSAQGVSCTHGGTDISSPEGATVRACAAGQVVFSGLVPAGEGERAWAVTVLTSEGLRVTYLPLSRASVSKGADVHEGAALGQLAGEGDASSPGSHLHLGVKRGETRLDPMSFLASRVSEAAPPAPAAPCAPPRVSKGGAPVSSHVAKPVPGATSAPAQASASAAAAAPGHAGVSVQAGPVRSPSGASAPSLLPHASLPHLPVLTQVPHVADPTRVRTAEVGADLGSARDLLASTLARLALVGVAGACAWPVLRKVMDGHAARAAAAVAVRSDGA